MSAKPQLLLTLSPDPAHAPGSTTDFHSLVLPHLDAAYNLARWLLRNRHDTEDAVQEACLRAFRFFGDFRGGDARAWLLKIVRNTCYTSRQRNRPAAETVEFDETLFGADLSGPSPESAALRNDTRRRLSLALEALPARSREILVLRELEGMSYKEISEIADIPCGTVMSRLSRARSELRVSFAVVSGGFPSPGQPVCSNSR